MPLNIDPHYNSVVLSCPFNTPVEDPAQNGVVLGMHFDGQPDNGDPYRNNVVLNMRMEGSIGSSNIVDDTGKGIAVNGSPALSATQYKFGATSLYFNGTTQYLTIASNPDFGFGSGDFTIEFWSYLNTAVGSDTILDFRPVANNGTTSIIAQIDGVLSYTVTNTSVIISGTITAGVWNHIAIVRTSGVTKLYLNGISLGSITDTVVYSSTSLSIGRNVFSTAFDLSGYIDDLRITKGVARYTANFTPPTSELPAITEPFLDVTGKYISRNGDSRISPTQSMFGGKSAYFDGNDDWLSISSSSDFNFGSSDLTLELWINQSSRPDQYPRIIQFGDSWNTSSSWALIAGHADFGSDKFVLQIYAHNANASALLVSTTSIVFGTWYHVAITRSGSSWKLFINGMVEASATWSGAVDTGANTCNIGIAPHPTYSPNSSYHGYIDDLRITKGYARYTSNFVPPTTPFPYTSGIPRFKDYSLVEKIPTPTGSPVVLPKTGSNTGALYLDGNSYYAFNGETDFAFGTGDFTVEMNIMTENVATDWTIWDSRTTGGHGAYLTIVSRNDGVVGVYVSSAWRITTTWVANTWYHLAVCRTNGITTLFLNGIPKGSWIDATDYLNTALRPIIGESGWGAGYKFKGWIDNLRVTKGVSRYTSAFPPPTTEFPNSQPAFKDETGKYLNSTATVISTAQKKYGSASAYFNGSSNLFYNSEPEFALGLENFTIEMWVYPTVLSATYQALIDFRPSGVSGIYPSILLNNTSVIWHIDGVDKATAGHSWLVNTWHHIALVREAGVVKIYLDGAMTANVTDINSYLIGAGGRPVLGESGWNPGNNRFTGYMDDFRITKGIARYIANFTPPTAELDHTSSDIYLKENIAFSHFNLKDANGDPYHDAVVLSINGNGRTDNGDAARDEVTRNFRFDGGRPDNGDPYKDEVVLNMRMNGHGGSTSILDDTGKTVTVNGNAAISTAQSKFGGSSCYFDGEGDYLDTSGASLALTGDFTIEFWVWTAPSVMQWGRVLENVQYTTTGGWHFSYNGTDAVGSMRLGLQLGLSPSGGGSRIDSNAAIPTSQWVHISVTRLSGIIRMFVNGVMQSATLSTSESFTSQNLRVGAALGTPSNYFNGYIDDLRITKGVARYTANFTPATRPIPISAPLTIKDDCGSSITPASGAYISDSVKKFGKYSCYFDGSANGYLSLSLPYMESHTEFCIDCWVYPTDWGAAHNTIFSAWNQASNNPVAYRLTIQQTDHKFNFSGSEGGFALTSITAATLNTWYHIAVTKTTSGYNLYINGTLEASNSITTPLNVAGTYFFIGKNYSEWYFTGYIDDFRITKGNSRYSGNFTVPTTKIPQITEKNCFIDTTGRTITTANQAKVSSAVTKVGPKSMKFNGAADYIYWNLTDDLKFGSKDFTMELWLYKLGNNANHSRIWCTDGDYFHEVSFDLTPSGNPSVYMASDGESSWNLLSYVHPVALNNNQWYHLVVQRVGGSAFLFIDGIPYLMTTGLGTTALHPGSRITRGLAGQPGIDRGFNGYFDSFRLTMAARYNAAFTPPATPFEDFYTISGVVKNDLDLPCSRLVRAHAKVNPAIFKEAYSDAVTGAYQMILPSTEHYVVFFDDTAGTQHNALILDKVVPG